MSSPLRLALLAGEHLLASGTARRSRGRWRRSARWPRRRACAPAGCACAARRRARRTPCRPRRGGPGTSCRRSMTSRPWMARPALNVLVSKSVCEGCGCQNADEHLGVEPVRVAGLRADAVAEALPVVLGRRRDAVAVVAVANLVGRLELAQRLLHRGELRVAADAAGGAPPRCSRRCGGRSSRTGAGRSPSRPAARAGGRAPCEMAAIFARTSEPMLPSTRS